MAIIIAFANQKGGVGKTTTAQNVGAELQDRGRRVLLVDCDPQGSLTSAVGLDPRQLGTRHLYPMVRAVVEGKEPPDLHDALWQLETGEHILPANLDLADAELDLQHVNFGPHVLADLLRPLVAEYDVVLLDCPPSLGLLTSNALIASQYVLVPITPEYLAAQGFERLMQKVVSKIQAHPRLNPDLRVLGIVLTMVKPRSGGQRLTEGEILSYADSLRVPVLGRIRDAVVVADAPAAGMAVTRYPAGNGAAQDYRNLVTALIGALEEQEAEA